MKKHIKKVILCLIKRLVHTIFIESKGHRTLILKLYCATPKLKLCHFFSEILNLFLENTCTRYIIQKFNVLKTSHIYYLSKYYHVKLDQGNKLIYMYSLAGS